MFFDIDVWLEEYLKNLKLLFGPRLEFVGLQGSYGRGEATDDSDIDVVVILDCVSSKDLKVYSTMLDSLSNRGKICGFISGRQELNNWERSDLFQFYYDTIPLIGSIDFLQSLICKEDVFRAVRIGACNIYHMCGHNMVHEKDGEILKSLYKSAVFTVQAVYYTQTGNYIKQKSMLALVLQSPEKEIMQTAIALQQYPEKALTEFDLLSELLFQWAAGLIFKY